MDAFAKRCKRQTIFRILCSNFVHTNYWDNQSDSILNFWSAFFNYFSIFSLASPVNCRPFQKNSSTLAWIPFSINGFFLSLRILIDLALTLDSFLRSVSVILTRTFICRYFFIMFPQITFLIACCSWSFVFFLATFISSERAFANSSLFLIGFGITLRLTPESLNSSSTLLLGVVASLWFWNEEDLG